MPTFGLDIQHKYGSSAKFKRKFVDWKIKISLFDPLQQTLLVEAETKQLDHKFF
jgi:hypothetical protein